MQQFARGMKGELVSSHYVPRIIHQIFLSGALPPALAANVESLKHQNLGWEHRLYDARAAERLIAEYYGTTTLDLYHRIDERYGAARADFLRHLILFQFGGVYCDIKSTFDIPLQQTLREDDRYLLAQWRNGPGELNEGFGLHRDLAHVPGGEYITYFIISEPRHPFSAAAIDYIKRNIRNYRPWSAVGRTGVLRTTGPIAYTLAIYPILNEHPHRIVSEQEIGARPALEEGYDHLGTFKYHYSTLSSPVVKLGLASTLASRFFVMLRAIKFALKVKSQAI
jgi:mannosyltransferase OCH1-like enzyme